MEASNLSLHTWFTAFLLMSATKKRFSCLKLHRQLGLRRYETSFNLMHKIRILMGKKDDLYRLNGMVEYDVRPSFQKPSLRSFKINSRGGKGIQKQAIVAFAAEYPYQKISLLEKSAGIVGSSK